MGRAASGKLHVLAVHEKKFWQERPKSGFCIEHPSTPSRSPVDLRLLTFLAALLCWPSLALADPGHSSDGLRVETIRAEAQGNTAVAIFLVRNMGDELAGIELAYTEQGEVAIDLPVMLNPGDVLMLQATYTPEGVLPDFFSIMFDFGDGSIAPVLVAIP